VLCLRQGCRNPDCEDEALYMGVEKRNGVVITEAGHKWSNAEYFALTGIKEYAPYMFGGGCASWRPARVLASAVYRTVCYGYKCSSSHRVTSVHRVCYAITRLRHDKTMMSSYR